VKRYVFLVIFAVAAIINILIYWNQHLYYRAKNKVEDSEQKIRILESAKKIYPFNSFVSHELGKLYFDKGIQDLSNVEPRDEYLKKSIANFGHSIRLNPASLYSHFQFAQSLLYMSHLSPTFEADFYDEYKKAALLTGHNTQVFYEVGRILFSRWPSLSPEEKTFTADMLKKIMRKRQRDQLQNIFQIWVISVNDYKTMEKILPEDAGVYRQYARFLGERSLSLQERQKILSRAEALEFERAKGEYRTGLREFQFFRLDQAFKHFRACMQLLNNIRFYQNFAQTQLIDHSEFARLKKSVILNTAKCLIEKRENPDCAMDYLLSYLSLERAPGVVDELVSYLKIRHVVKDDENAALDDLSKLSFRLLLDFKRNRYREIMKVGKRLRQSFLAVPEEAKNDYVRVLQFVGDSFRKVDNMYDAEEFYDKAFEIDPQNLETLLRMQKNYDRLNEEEKIKEVNIKIEKILSPGESTPRKPLMLKGKTLAYTLTLDGRKIRLSLHFQKEKNGRPLLVSVLFNDALAWEGYLEGDRITIPTNTAVGPNQVRITPVNGNASMIKIAYSVE